MDCWFSFRPHFRFSFNSIHVKSPYSRKKSLFISRITDFRIDSSIKIDLAIIFSICFRFYCFTTAAAAAVATAISQPEKTLKRARELIQKKRERDKKWKKWHRQIAIQFHSTNPFNLSQVVLLLDSNLCVFTCAALFDINHTQNAYRHPIWYVFLTFI